MRRQTRRVMPGRQDLLRLAAIVSWVLLAVLSLLPGGYRPHTGASGNVEHALAYGLSALSTRLAFRTTPSRLQLAAFAIVAAMFEICQIWIPGRTAAVGNWFASAAGAFAGIAIGRALAHRLRRHVRIVPAERHEPRPE